MLENFFHQIITSDDFVGILATIVFSIGGWSLTKSMERESKKNLISE